MRRCDGVRSAGRGFTLIELTVVLAVIVTLALVLTPSIANFINDSRIARARSDCQTIASAIVQFYRDTAFFPEWVVSQNGGPGTGGNQPVLLVSPGNVPAIGGSVPVLSDDQVRPWLNSKAGSLADQLLTNRPGYALKGPGSEFGWNGPYLSSALGSDPWNNRYMVNVAQIDVSQGVQNQLGTIKNAAWVLSAGPNGVIETAFSQSVLAAALAGDDIGVRIQ
jgi:prepilin-type N-terminal cleavage/methylation domain-containing protein